MKKLTLITSTLLVVLSFCSYAQDKKTPYTVKKEALRVKLFSELGLPLINSTSNVNDFFDLIINKTTTKQGTLLVTKYRQDIKDLEQEMKNVTIPQEYPINTIMNIGKSPDDDLVKEPDTVYSLGVDSPPSYPGGDAKFYALLYDNIIYPEEAKQKCVVGRVGISFVVEKDGALTDIKVDRKLGYGTDEEALRVVKLSRRWNPGFLNGKTVRVKYKVSVNFTLSQ